MASKCLVCCGATIAVTGILLNLAIPIASFVIAAQNWNSTCDILAIVRLPVWLVVNGVITAVIGLTLWISVGFLILFKNPVFMIISIVSVVLSFLFIIPWNVIGAISLFRDSMSCQVNANSLFAMTIAALAIQWYSILQNCCGSCSIKSSANDNV